MFLTGIRLLLVTGKGRPAFTENNCITLQAQNTTALQRNVFNWNTFVAVHRQRTVGFYGK